MIQIFQEEPFISTGIVGFLLSSVFIRVLLGFLYRNMIKEADNMAATNNKLLKQCKLKFANCYQLNNGVANIPVFVDKFINRLALGPFSFDTLYHLSGQCMLLSVICAGIGVCRSIMLGRTFGELLPYYIMSFIGLYFYFSISTVVDIKTHRRILKVNLVDYLENHLSARIGVTESDIEMLYGEDFPVCGRQMHIVGDTGRRGLPSWKGARGGRRTVELMPIGNRLNDGSMDSVASLAAGQETTGRKDAQPNEEIRMTGQSSLTQNKGSVNYGNFQITEEELEALIKEFC